MSFFDFSVAGRGLTFDQIRNLCRFAIRRLNEERLPQVAGSLTFTTVLAIVPVLTIAFAIFTTFPLFNTFRKGVEAYFIQNLMPQGISNTILGYLNQFAAQAKRLSAVGAVFLILTAVAMIAMVDRTFNQIWKVRTKRPFAQRILVYWATVTLGPLLIGISISVTSYVFTATTGAVGGTPIFGSVVYTAISIALTAGAFTLLYMAVPNRLVDWRDALCGGVVAAIAFEVTKRVFAVFITKFPTYTVVYGALAAIPIFLVWIYVGWLITLIGAVLAAALPVVKYERWWHVARPGSEFIDAVSILRVLYEAREASDTAIVNGHLIRDRTRLGFEESDNLLQRMLDEGWVGRIRPEATRRMQFGKKITEGLDRWVLVANPAHLKLADVYRLFAFDVASRSAAANKAREAISHGLDQSLADYYSGRA